MFHRREMLPVTIAIGASLGLGACRETPLYDSVGGQFSGSGTMADRESQIRRAAAAQGGWTIQPVRYGLLRATNAWRSHQMTVDIAFDLRTFSIRYVNSVNLDYDGARIHSAYNDRVRGLEAAILRTPPDAAVSRAGSGARGAAATTATVPGPTASTRSQRLSEGVSELPVGAVPDTSALPASRRY